MKKSTPILGPTFGNDTSCPHPASRQLRLLAQLRHGRYLGRAKAGQSLVEFALTIPFLIVLLMVLIEVGFLLRSTTEVTTGVREASRVASTAANTDPWRVLPGGGFERGNTDGDSVAIAQINNTLGRELPNAQRLMIYRADQTVVTSTASATSWPVVFNIPQGNGVLNPAQPGADPLAPNFRTRLQFQWPAQELFDRSSPGGPFVSRVLTNNQAGCNNADITKTPSSIYTYTGSFCGQNYATPADRPYKDLLSQGITGATTIAQRKIDNPWYPTVRRAAAGACDLSSNISLNASNYANYYLNPYFRPAWIGVRVDYTHAWTTGFFPIPTIALSDRNVKQLEASNNPCL